MALRGASCHAQLAACQPLFANLVNIGAADRSLKWSGNLVVQAGDARRGGLGCSGHKFLKLSPPSLAPSEASTASKTSGRGTRNFLALSFEVIDLSRLFQSVKLDKLPIAQNGGLGGKSFQSFWLVTDDHNGCPINPFLQ